MDLTLTPEQQELKDAVRHFCQEEVTPERQVAWEREPRGIDARSWQSIAGLGWLGLGVPAGAGGSGLGLVEVACLLEECARGLIPHAVIAAVRGAWALARLDPQAPELPALATGERAVTLALDEEHCREAHQYRTSAEPSGGAVRLHGRKWYVPDGAHADDHIVAARDGAEVALFLVGRAHAQIESLRTFAGDRQAIVHYAGAPAIRRLSAPGCGAGALETLQREQAALALAEMLGGMDWALDTTVKYVKEREQFGQKLAVFQAVQHQVADMATAFTASRHLSWQAITRIAAGTQQGTELSSALAFVGQAFKRVTWAAHHLHGGAGFVVEHPLHYHSERAQSLCIRYAPEAPALAAVASSLLD